MEGGFYMEDPKKNQILINDFFEGTQIKKELINDIGQNNVKELGRILSETCEVETDEVDRKGKKKKIKFNSQLTNNQIRKYYDSFLKIYNSKVSEEVKKIQLLMLKANSEYSAERNGTYRFGMFLNNRLNIVISKSDEEFIKYLDAFKLHFEALVGYYPRKQEN